MDLLEFSTTFTFSCEKREILSAVRYTVNHDAHGAAEVAGETEGCGGACICLSASVFLRSRHRPKNLLHFRLFKKHFHNFKYNNFLFGKTLWIIHVYLAFIYLFSSPERKGLKKELR